MREKKLTANVDVDIVGILEKLWNRKLLILFITTLFAFFGFLSFKLLVNNEEYNTASIFVKYPDKEIFNNKRILLDYERYAEIFSEFTESDFHLIEFIENNQKIDNFKSWFKIKNINGHDYIRDNLSGSYFKKNKGNNLILEYPHGTEGGIFLTDYIFYIKDKSLQKFLELNEYLLNNKIETYQHNLNIAESIGLDIPTILQKKNDQRNTQLVNEPKALFYQGSKVLQYELDYLKGFTKSKINELINYVPIKDKAKINKVLMNKKLLLYTSMGFIIGLCISIFIIFIRINFGRKNH